MGAGRSLARHFQFGLVYETLLDLFLPPRHAGIAANLEAQVAGGEGSQGGLQVIAKEKMLRKEREENRELDDRLHEFSGVRTKLMNAQEDLKRLSNVFDR